MHLEPGSELLPVIETGTHEGMRKYPLRARKPEHKSPQVCKRRRKATSVEGFSMTDTYV